MRTARRLTIGPSSVLDSDQLIRVVFAGCDTDDVDPVTLRPDRWASLVSERPVLRGHAFVRLQLK